MSARRNFFAKQVDEFKRERELLYEQMEELEATQTAEEIQDRVSKAEIKVVEADIKLVEADIELVEAEIVTLRAAPNSEKPEIQIQILNKQIELVELQIRSTTDPVEKNQLREKERQLRAEKNTLLTGALGEGTTNTTAEALATIQQDLATLKRQHASSIRISHASTQTATALAQSIGVSATVHSTGITARYEHPLELQHLFDWGPYTHHKPVTGGVKYDEDLASSALRNFLITVLKDNSLYGRSFFEVYDVRRFQNLLTQEFSDQKFKGTTDAIVAPHGLIAEGSLSQARYVVDWKTPQTMAQLQKSLAARFDPSGHKLKKEERITCGMPFVEFFCSAAKSQTLFEVVFTDMCTSALILRVNEQGELQVDLNIPVENMLGSLTQNLRVDTGCRHTAFKDLPDSEEKNLFTVIKKAKLEDPRVEQLFGPFGLLEDMSHHEQKVTLHQAFPDGLEMMFL